MQLLKAVVTVGGWTTVSRILGMLREMLMTHFIGVNLVSDAFVIAFKLPNFFRRFFAEGALSASFVPLFSQKLATEGTEKAYVLACHVFSLMTFFLLGFVLLFECFAPSVLKILAPGFNDNIEFMNTAVEFARLTFPYILFVSLAAFLGGILNTFDKFWVTAASPALLNIIMILALLISTPSIAEKGANLSFAVLIAGGVQFIFLYLACYQNNFYPKIITPIISPEIKLILKRLGPGMIGAGVMQINMLIDLQLASLLEQGSLSYLYYADRLYQLPMSVFGVAVGTALLPALSKLWQTQKRKEAIALQNKALKFVIFMNVPAALGLIILSTPIISLLFEHGAFTKADVMRTAPTLAAYALGLPAYVIIKVFSTTFFAQGDTKTPVKIAIYVVFINLALNLLLMKYLEHVGLALATSITAYLQMCVLCIILVRRNLLSFSKDFYYFSIKTLIATGVMGIILYGGGPVFLDLSMSHLPQYFVSSKGFVVLSVILQIVISFLSYMVVGFYLGVIHSMKETQQ